MSQKKCLIQNAKTTSYVSFLLAYCPVVWRCKKSYSDSWAHDCISSSDRSDAFDHRPSVRRYVWVLICGGLYQIAENRAVIILFKIWVTVILICQSCFQHREDAQYSIATAALIGQWVTCGRLAWAFARDVIIPNLTLLAPLMLNKHGLPNSTDYSHISERYRFPVRTTVLSL